MVRLTPDHWSAVEMRSNGWTYATIALELGCSVEEVEQRIDAVTRVMSLRLNAEQEAVCGQHDGV